MSIHSALSCYVAVGFAVAGVYAVGLLRRRARGERSVLEEERHKAALDLALGLAAVAIVLQIVTGDLSARAVARHEPVKLAAMESLFQTERGAPLLVGGWPDPATEEVHGAIRIPKGLSFLAAEDFDAEIPGLAQLAPPEDRPNVVVTHLAFQTMVGAGFLLAAVAALYWLVRWKHHAPEEPKHLLRALSIASPFGFVALEAGWVVTEVGRQPWVVRGVLRTRDAVTPVPSVSISFFAFTLLYLALGAALVFLLRGLAHRRGKGEDHA
jgi:cytochrome d ubiquinol oxidase subunit I